MNVIHPIKEDLPELKQIWKEIFKDTDFYINLFFEKKYAPENTFLIKADGKIASMLFFFETIFRFHGRKVPVAYICGVATREAYRGKGFSRLILEHAIDDIRKKGYQAVFLIPASQSLFEFYQKAAGFVPYFYLNTIQPDVKVNDGEELREVPFSAERFADFYEKLNRQNGFYCDKDPKEFEDIFAFYHPEGSEFHLFESGYLIFHCKDKTLFVTESYFETTEEQNKAFSYFMKKNNCEKAMLTVPSFGQKNTPYASILILDETVRDILKTENNYVNIMFN